MDAFRRSKVQWNRFPKCGGPVSFRTSLKGAYTEVN